MDGTLTFLNRKTAVKLNGNGIRAVLNSNGVRRYLTGLAQDVLAEAVATAPVAEGDYVNGLHIEQGTTDRVVVRVRGNTEHDWFVEAQYGTLARAIGAAGGVRGSDVTASPLDDLVQYTTKAGVTRTATKAQVNNWTRGAR